MKKDIVIITILFTLGFAGASLYSVFNPWRPPRPNLSSTSPNVFPYPPADQIAFFPRACIIMSGAIETGAFLVTGYVLVFARRLELLEYLFAFWVLAPPAWFFFDYLTLFRHYGNHDAFESLKYIHELSTRLWAGGIALIGGAIWYEIEKEKRDSTKAVSMRERKNDEGRIHRRHRGHRG